MSLPSADLNDALEALILRTRHGEQEAYHLFLQTLAPLLRRMLYRPLYACGQHHAVEDIVQETLLAIHLKLHTYDATKPFLAWLRIIAKHKMIDFLRRHKNNTSSLDEDGFGELEDTSQSTETMVVRDLDKLLSQLKPPSGDLIYGLKVEGATISDLAQKYGLTESNVKVLVHRGLQKLSQLARGATRGTTP
ncbi:MAG: sigma-70 family RNA polymerase sigma factor, partial [Pseudomonadota bacterium]